MIQGYIYSFFSVLLQQAHLKVNIKSVSVERLVFPGFSNMVNVLLKCDPSAKHALGL